MRKYKGEHPHLVAPGLDSSLGRHTKGQAKSKTQKGCDAERLAQSKKHRTIPAVF
jgi:hypothetical protein